MVPTYRDKALQGKKQAVSSNVFKNWPSRPFSSQPSYEQSTHSQDSQSRTRVSGTAQTDLARAAICAEKRQRPPMVVRITSTASNIPGPPTTLLLT